MNARSSMMEVVIRIMMASPATGLINVEIKLCLGYEVVQRYEIRDASWYKW